MAPEVFFGVCYGQSVPPKAIQALHTFTPAVLKDHSRHRVRSEDYPGVIPQEGHSVKGIFATGLTDANMLKLDEFEGPEYSKKKVTIKTLSTVDGKEVEGGSVETSVYIFLHPDYLDMREWDFEQFKREKMKFWTRGDWSFDDSRFSHLYLWHLC